MANVAHSTLTGSDLHEPKGVDTASSGQIYVANGAGSGTWTSVSALNIPGRWKLINTYTPSAAASQGITGFNASLYSDYKIILEKILPSSGTSGGLRMRLSSNGGASYLATSSAYWYHTERYRAGNTYGNFTEANANAILFIDVNVSTSDGIFGEISIIKPSVSSLTPVSYDVCSSTTGYKGSAGLNAADTTDAAQILFVNGNIASGTVRLYGLTI